MLGANQYGKAENRVVRIYRETERHEIRDLNVSTSLRGDFRTPTSPATRPRCCRRTPRRTPPSPTPRSTGSPPRRTTRSRSATHFLDAAPPATGARIGVEEYAWDRIQVDGAGHDHSFVRRGTETRTSVVTVEGRGEDQQVWVVSGFSDLVVLKSTGSEFKGFLKDRYTTLQETDDRIMATSLTARWRYEGTAPRRDIDWNGVYEDDQGDHC